MNNKLGRLSAPYFVVMTLLVIIPLFLMLILAFSETKGLSFEGLNLTMQNLKRFFTEEYIIEAIINSLIYAAIATVISLLIAYPVAYFVSSLKTDKKILIILLIVLPMWSNQILRIVSWENIFRFLDLYRLDSKGKDTFMMFRVIVGMVSIYLPFMIFPIYTALEKIDKSLLEASSDLGCTGMQTMRKVVIPLSMPGIISGIVMVFLPAMTAFALPKQLSNGRLKLIGTIIEENFRNGIGHNMGSFISLTILIVIVVLTLFGQGGATHE